ncbi:JAG1 [Branchiostoma lanceolatum]|uniref:JAG1 protein n=1 Tax=Branchiostoma lanceolatum TaxID=7740 RepID=A0A8K0ERX6_BRALA|nr:JAG1 [Branchiostoma lanceolatum]
MANLIGFAVVLLSVCILHVTPNLIRLEVGKQYQYRYEATTEVRNVGVFLTTTKVTIVPLKHVAAGQLCQMQLSHTAMNFVARHQYGSPMYEGKWDFSKWLSFVMTPHGEVISIFYPPDEDKEVLAMKKGILGTLSARLHDGSESSTRNRWRYEVDEKGHEGQHRAGYSAERKHDHTLFKKEKYGHVVPNAKASHKKDIVYNHVTGVPHSISITESVAAPKEAAQGFKATSGMDDVTFDSKEHTDLPDMDASSKSSMQFLGIRKSTTRMSQPGDLVEDTLTLHQLPGPHMGYDVMENWIAGNLTCMRTVLPKSSSKRAACYRHIVDSLALLSSEDLHKVSDVYIRPNINETAIDIENREAIIDGFGALASNDSLTILIETVLLSPEPVFELVQKVLLHVAVLQHPPPEAITDLLEKRCFDGNPFSKDSEEDHKLRSQGFLVLGIIAKLLKGKDDKRSEVIVKKLEEHLEVFDPWTHRKRRSTMSKEETKVHDRYKANLLGALGNAGREKSYEHVLSYVNIAESPHVLRRHAIAALGGFHNMKAAHKLLALSADDDEDIQRAAKLEFRTHPKAKDLADVFLQKTRQVNVTKNDIVSRQKRDFYGIPGLVGVEIDELASLGDTQAGVDDTGIFLDMPLLEYKFVASLGSQAIGSSVGVILDNGANLRADIASGSFVEARVHDEAWAEAHIGILGLNYDFFRLRACLKLSISYDLNILNEFGYDDVNDFADAFSRIVLNVTTFIVDATKKLLSNLTELLNQIGSTDLSDLFSDVIREIEKQVELLRLLRAARAVATNALGNIDIAQLVTDPNVAFITTIVRKSADLVSDAIRELSAFHKVASDIGGVTLPVANRHMYEGIRLISQTIGNIFQSPKTAMKDVEKAMYKIQHAMQVSTEARTVLRDAAFRNGEKPFWSAITENADRLTDELDASAQLLLGDKGETVDHILSEAAQSMKDAMKELKVRFRSLEATFESLENKVAKIKEGSNEVKRGYHSAKSMMDHVFGPKMDNEFPRQQLQPAGHSRRSKRSCPRTMGKFPSDGNGKYTFHGVDLEISAGRTLVAPFTGKAFRPSNSSGQVTIIADELHGVHVVINNVDLFDGLENKTVYKGELLGRVNTSDCQPNSIHLAMVNISGDIAFAIDPTPYLEQKEMPIPQLNQQCGDFLLRIASRTILGVDVDIKMTGFEDASPVRVTPTELPDIIRSLSEMFGNWQSGGRRETRGAQTELGSQDVLGIQDLIRDPTMAFSTGNLRVSDLIRILGEEGLVASKAKLQDLMQKLETFLQAKPSCSSPRFMIDSQLRDMLNSLQQSTSGSRNQLIQRIFRTPSLCSHLDIASPGDSFCQFDSDCQSASCCVDIVYDHRPHTVTFGLDVDPCPSTVRLSVGSWGRNFSVGSPTFGEEGSEVITDAFGSGTDLTLHIDYSIIRKGDSVMINIQGKACKPTTCSPTFWLSRNSIARFATCNSQSRREIRSVQEALGSKNQIEELTVFALQGIVESVMEDQADIIAEIISDVHNLVKGAAVVTLQLANTVDIFVNGDIKFEADVPLTAMNLDLFRLYWPYMLGPIPLIFGFGAGVNGGARAHATFHLRSMKMDMELVPQVGGHVLGDFGIWLLLFTGKMRLVGYICETSFPMYWQFDYGSDDTGDKYAQYQVMVPFRLELRGIVVAHLIFFDKTIVNILIWHWSTTSNTKKVKESENYKQDPSPPLFEGGIVPYAERCGQLKGKWSLLHSRQERKVVPAFLCAQSGFVSSGKRSARADHCFVEQVKGRDYTEPAFQLGFHMEDERSEVRSTLCVGTYRGGCDAIGNEPIGGAWSPLSKTLPAGIPLYFTVTGTNARGLSSSVSCQMDTYDITPPVARITPSFYSTSNPLYLRASAIVQDDSSIDIVRGGVGYGSDVYGDQVVSWHDVSLDTTGPPVTTANPLDNFAEGKKGRLNSRPHQTNRFVIPEDCAKLCLTFPTTKCLSFNYDYGSTGTCEILEELEVPGVRLHQTGHFHHYERRGVGKMLEFDFDSLSLRHDNLYYFNVYLQNSLGYASILTSRGIIVDHTPPSPGLISDNRWDQVYGEVCEDFIPDEWEHKCIQQTTLPNHRAIVDGEGSRTVFNGHEPLEDMLYTRANTYVSANWDGFHDNETGIFGYTWTVGTTPCQEDIHPHKDPHSHLFDESEWTHTGIADGLDLPDGMYHVTVRAINKVEFGGPMATTVCHSTPYTIDNTPPFVHSVTNVNYDDDVQLISVEYNVSDSLSKIREVDLGLGRSKRDVYLMDWHRDDNTTHITHNYHIPDGVPAWVRIRAINNVDLRKAGHANSPILVDTSPPTAGSVFDGPTAGHDINFQNDQSEICANWRDFHDEESGIDYYLWGVGTFAGAVDIVPLDVVSHSSFRGCKQLFMPLLHNKTYYSTLIALNGGHKHLNISVSSDGVLVDTTPPTMGWIKDGLDKDADMQFSSEQSSISANWAGFTDPESGIASYSVSVTRRHASKGNDTSDWEVIHPPQEVDSNTDHINWHHFHLHHGDTVAAQLTAINKAGSHVTVESDGFVVDTTPPVLHFLGDGPAAGMNKKFSSSLSFLSANWVFEDKESDLDHFKISVFETHGGRKHTLYLGDSKEQIIPGSIVNWTSPQLNLRPGRHYSIRVTAVNRAGLSSVHDTDGVVLDTTPPSMVKVRVGVLASDVEEVLDGFVWQTDRKGILANWLASDGQSGIEAYWIAVGSYPGGYDISELRSMGPAIDGYIEGIDLQLTDLNTNTPVYYVTVLAKNGAGLLSQNLTSRPIKVVPGDRPGVVFDGPLTVSNETHTNPVDVDFQRDNTAVTVQFEGFRSVLNGLAHFEWAIGTSPRLDDIQPFSAAGIVLTQDSQHPGYGLHGSGQAQALVPLQAGATYYATVRGVTGSGDVLETSSDGITVDRSPPVTQIVDIGCDVSNKSSGNVEHCYQTSSDYLEGEWDTVDNESAVAYSAFFYGTAPGLSDITQLTSGTDENSVPSTLVVPVSDGRPNFLNVLATNEVGLKSVTTSNGIIVDDTPPDVGIVSCSRYVQPRVPITCTWTGFHDKESDISRYIFGLGTDEGDDSIYNFTHVPTALSSTDELLKGVNLEHGGTYYATLSAVNGVGLQAQAFSEPITVDMTPPAPGLVIELTGVDLVELQPPYNLTDVAICNSREDCEKHNAVCQKSLTSVYAAWEDFLDPESPVIRYEVAAGTAPGLSDIYPFTTVEGAKRSAVIDGLDLSQQRQVFVMVRAHNAAGLVNTVTSDGVFISRVSSGLIPLRPPIVYDGETMREDMDYQERTDQLAATWDFSGDPCPIVKYEWSIVRVDEHVLQPLTVVPEGQTYGQNDQVDLMDKQTYYSIVRATNTLGYSYFVRSDGITITKEPLLPGHVRDGDIFGVDLNGQPSVTTISANWDQFGGPAMEIQYYEIAVGSDRGFPSTRSNIHPFKNVGLNRTATFTDLRLVPGGFYYLTVRARSLSTAVAEISSNGITVGVGGEPPKPQSVDIPRFISSNEAITFAWDDFLSEMPMLFYQWGMTSRARAEIQDRSCNDMQEFQESEAVSVPEDIRHLFDIHPLTTVGKDTMIEQHGLNLEHGQTYTVAVIGTNEASECVTVAHEVSVDTTPPTGGAIVVGERDLETIHFVRSPDMMHVAWEGFHDEDSGIKSVEVALYERMTCSHPSGTLVALTELIDVPLNSSDCLFREIVLQVAVPYYVQLKVTNNAELSALFTSSPILLDNTDPIAGAVVDGQDFRKDRSHQNYTDRMEGVFLHLPSPYGDSCPRRRYDLAAESEDWSAVLTSGVWKAGRTDTILFLPDQISYWEDDGLAIKMQRDIRGPRMKSCAVHTKALLQEAGKYQMTIQAAGGDISAVTSVTFWGGPEGVVAGFNTSFDEYVEETTAAASGECDCCFNTTTLAPAAGMYNDSSHDEADVCNCSCPTLVITESVDNVTVGRTTTDDPGLGVFWEFERQPIPGDTFSGPEEDWGKDHPSFGLQLQKGRGTENYYAVMWLQPAIAGHEPQQEVFELNFDPSEAFHVYTLDFQVDRTDPKNEIWSVDLIIDGVRALALSGLPSLPIDAVVTFSVWNFDDFVPEVEDPFYPPTATANFKDVSFPASSDQLCRYGEPFRDGDSAILSFLAGVGTEAHQDDVVPFRMVPYHSCIPCLRDCDNFYCSNDCDGSVVSEYHVLLDNMVLDVNRTVKDGSDNVTVPAKYHMTIKATTASGRQVVASSDGVYIDVTPPRFESLFHVDTSWSMDEQTEFQGSNSSIAVRWRAIDMESKIKEYRWAIGTSKGATDIRDFDTIIPKDEKDVLAVAEDLEGHLEDGGVYYVTVVAFNLAGLEETVYTNGVTVLMAEPNTTSANISIPGAVPIAPGVVSSEDQTSFRFMWTAVEDAGIDAYYFSVGSAQSTPDDIVPRTQVGVNGSGYVFIHDGVVDFEGFNGDISDMRERSIDDANKTFPNNFLMEPGRNLFVNMDACNAGHKCGGIQSPIVVIRRDGDAIGTSTNGEDLTLECEGHPSDGANATVVVKTTGGLHAGEKIMCSPLSEQDAVQEYTSDASARFKPIIVNPYQTAELTDRNLRHRIRGYTGHSFVLSSIAGQKLRGPLNITVKIENVTTAPSQVPKLLFWNAESEMWQDAGRTCQSFTQTYTYKNTSEFSVLVCNTSTVPANSNSLRREKRSQQGEEFLRKETFFIVALVDTSFQNSAPRLAVSPNLWTYEDRPIVAYLEAIDDDDDDVTFSVDRSTETSLIGDVEIDPRGKLHYRPCKDCFGQDYVTVVVSENRNDGEMPLVTRETLSIEVLALEDNPEIFAVKDGSKENSTGDSITVALEENTAQRVDQSKYDVLVFGADVDTYDVPFLVLHDPRNGTLVVSKTVRSIDFVRVDTNYSSTVVDGANFADESTEAVSILYPQNFLMPHRPEQYSWVAVGFTYIPDMDFYGDDQVRVYAHDQSGKRSDVLTFDFFVLENRCMNGGLCTGPNHDPNCTDVQRSISFSGYECACPDGYFGRYCESDFNECSSDPCPKNYTCVDLPNDFLCDCGSSDWPCASQSMPPWQIALITLMCLGVTIIVVACAVRKKANNKKASKIEPHYISGEDIELSNMRNERPTSLAELKKNPWFQPELPTEAPQAPKFPLKALKETNANKTEESGSRRARQLPPLN